MNLRHFAIVLLGVLVVLGVSDIAGMRTFDELAAIAYFILYFVAAAILCLLSIRGLKADVSYARVLDIAGITIALGSVLATAGHFLWLIS